MDNKELVILAGKQGGGGGGGGGEVTPASVALAISRMTDAQAAQALADLGYVVDQGLDEDSGNPVRNSVLTGLFAVVQLALTQKANKETIVQVSGTTVDITPEDNYDYQCETLVSLTVTNPPASGSYSIVFTSGSTPTVTTIPASIIFQEAFAAKANTRYEINVLDGYAVVGSWPVGVST